MNVAEIVTTTSIDPSAQVSHIRCFFGPYYWDTLGASPSTTPAATSYESQIWFSGSLDFFCDVLVSPFTR